LQTARYLFVERSYCGRQQAVQLEELALTVGKTCSFIQQRIVQEIIADAICGEEIIFRALTAV